MKKIFSIRKLAIGVASVSLGMTGVSSINSTNTSSASYYSDYNYSPYNYSSFTSSDYIELEPKSYYELKVGKEVTVVRSKSPINSYYATGNRIVDIESATVSKTGSITNEFGRTINMNFDGYELRVTPLRAGTSIIHFEQNGVEKTIEVKVVNDVSEKQEKTTQEIPFETIYNDDNNLNTGEEIVDREGIPGLKEINSTYTVINGIRQSNPKVEEIIDKIVRRGTKVTTYESEKNVQNIPFETIYKDDNTLDKGKEVVETEGVNGTKEIITTYTVINGTRQDNPKIEENTTKEKVDKVVRRGSKVTTYESEKNIQNIPFKTIYKDDNTLDKGTEVTETEGVNGTKEITTTYTVINGIRQENPKVEEKVTKNKVDKVVKHGTKDITSSSDNNSGYTISIPNNPTSGNWINSGGRWWYKHNDGSYTANGWEKINGTWYHFDKAGWMQIGWLKDNGSWYYLTNSGAMKTSWLKDNGSWYYLTNSGAMKTGWLKDNGTWYYLTNSGAMKTGWLKDNGSWYYLTNSGAMKTGWLQVSGKWYYAYTSGALAINTITPDGYRVNYNGEWIR